MAEGSITLAELAKSGRHVIVQCGACPNRRLMKPTELGVPLTNPVATAGPLLKCSECGSKRVLTYPESNRDVRKGRVR
jgi:DNA-directed RNA polymerase subunit RPC12/RpoP